MNINQLIIIFVAFLFSVSAFSLEERRSSKISTSYMSGGNSYKSYSIDSAIGVNEKWQVTGSYFYADSGQSSSTTEQLISHEIRLGLDFKFHPAWGSYFELIAREDPYALTGRGFAAGLSNDISEYWEGKLLTRISLSTQRIQYSQSSVLVGRRSTLNVQRTVNQTKRSVGVEQELIDWLLLQINYSNYHYDESTSQLGRATSARRTNFSGGSNPSYGLPDKSTTASLVVNPWEWGETSFSINQTTFLTDTKSKSKSWTLEQTIFYRSLEFTLSFTKTKYLDDSSGTDASTSDYTQVLVGYHW